VPKRAVANTATLRLFFCVLQAIIKSRTRSIPNQCMKRWGATGALMKSPVVKRSIIIGGHKTSVSLEDAFWTDLKEIAHSQGATLSKLIGQIDETRQQGNLSSAIRLHVLEHIRRHGRNDLVGAIRAD
jgi:predicted DNA-binding ribbon-helix-helix protein